MEGIFSGAWTLPTIPLSLSSNSEMGGIFSMEEENKAQGE